MSTSLESPKRLQSFLTAVQAHPPGCWVQHRGMRVSAFEGVCRRLGSPGVGSHLRVARMGTHHVHPAYIYDSDNNNSNDDNIKMYTSINYNYVYIAYYVYIYIYIYIVYYVYRSLSVCICVCIYIYICMAVLVN